MFFTDILTWSTSKVEEFSWPTHKTHKFVSNICEVPPLSCAPTLCPTPPRSDKQIYLDFLTTFFFGICVCVCGKVLIPKFEYIFYGPRDISKGNRIFIKLRVGHKLLAGKSWQGVEFVPLLLIARNFVRRLKNIVSCHTIKYIFYETKKPKSGTWCTFQRQHLGPTVDSFLPKSRMHFGMHKPTCCQRRAERSGIETDSFSAELARIGALTWPKPSPDDIGSQNNIFCSRLGCLCS